MTEGKQVLKEYKTIKEVVGPLMLVEGVEGVKYNELVEIVQKNGEVRRGKVLEVNRDKALVQLFENSQGLQIATSRAKFLGHGLELAAHEPFKGIQDAIEKCSDIHSRVRVFERVSDRMTVAETDTGEEIQSRIDDLKELVQKYRQYEF